MILALCVSSDSPPRPDRRRCVEADQDEARRLAEQREPGSHRPDQQRQARLRRRQRRRLGHRGSAVQDDLQKEIDLKISSRCQQLEVIN